MRSTTILAPILVLLLAAQSSAQSPEPCGSWSVVDVPFDPGWNRAEFEDVAVAPDSTVWAVGNAHLPSPPFGPEMVTLAMRYDGGTWTQTPTPYVAAFAGGANDTLHAVAALAPDEVWAAGERHGDAGGLSVGAWVHVLRWDGATWSEMPVPEPPGGAGINFSGTRVYDIAAFSSDDVWFAGAWAEPNHLATVTRRPLAMHWDGSEMTVHPTPTLFSGTEPLHLKQVAAVAPDDIWGICRSTTAGGTTDAPYVLHYDGGVWSQVGGLPDPGFSMVLDQITATVSDDVWIFGHEVFPTDPFALHWDGTNWTLLDGAPHASAAASLSADAHYLGTSTITLFDGSETAVVEPFTNVAGSSVLSMASTGTCQVWAVGRRIGGGDLAPFAAVMTEGPWTGIGGGLDGAHGQPMLTGSGDLVAGALVSLQLDDALEQASAWMVLGTVLLEAPFKGGVLVPRPDVLVPGPTTDALGSWTLAATWPAGIPSGNLVAAQAWVQDGAAPKGFAASAGLVATTP
jgi:hypothetical protein